MLLRELLKRSMTTDEMKKLNPKEEQGKAGEGGESGKREEEGG